MNNFTNSSSGSTSQVKSKRRVVEHGEVFTAEREVNAMLDLVKAETERIDARFLEPACGDGNFLIEILRRKMVVVLQQSANNLKAYQLNTCRAVASIYGVELLPDNAETCRERLFCYILEHLHTHFHRVDDAETTIDKFLSTIHFLLFHNIVCGDALTYTQLDGTPIVFSEWTFLGEHVSRSDYQFHFLVEQTHQYALFDEQGEPQHFDRPKQSFPPIHYLLLSSQDLIQSNNL